MILTLKRNESGILYAEVDISSETQPLIEKINSLEERIEKLEEKLTEVEMSGISELLKSLKNGIEITKIYSKT